MKGACHVNREGRPVHCQKRHPPCGWQGAPMETDCPPAMAPCFNISHVIDEHSPLHGKSLQDMQVRCWPPPDSALPQRPADWLILAEVLHAACHRTGLQLCNLAWSIVCYDKPSLPTSLLVCTRSSWQCLSATTACSMTTALFRRKIKMIRWSLETEGKLRSLASCSASLF